MLAVTAYNTTFFILKTVLDILIKIITYYIDAQMYKTLHENVIFFAFFRFALSTACLSLEKSVEPCQSPPSSVHCTSSTLAANVVAA
jgi:hypothetical protein